MSEHVPAWKRFQIKNTEQKREEDELDSLIVSTHLSTSSLSKKEKRRIIKGVSGEGNKVSKANKQAKERKREKLAREERLKKRESVLKDQLKYLIEFWTLKLELQLPDVLKQLPSVRDNGFASDATPTDDSNVVKEVWKFSKQKQNWLIKHFALLEEIPTEYDSLLVRYFQDLQGGSKKTLQQSCLAVVDTHCKYLQRQKDEMAKIVLGEQNTEGTIPEEKPTGSTKELPDEKTQKQEPTANEILAPSNELLQRACAMLDTWNVTYTLSD